MGNSKRAIRQSTFIGLTLLALFVALRVWDPAPLELLRVKTFDAYQTLRPRETGDLPVVIVDIDERSLREHGQWPWPRTRVAALVDRMTEAGAVAIAFDVLFAEPDKTSPDRIAAEIPGLDANLRRRLERLPTNDDRLAEAIARSRVILGQSGTGGDWQGESAAPRTSIARMNGDPRPHLLRFPDLLRNVAPLEEVAAGRGLFSLRAEIDGVVRRLPAVMTAEDTVMPSLALELLRVATGEQTILVRSGAAGIEAVVIGETLIPTDRNGQMWVHFGPSDPARYVSASAVLDGTAGADRLAGRLVLVGTSATGLLDIRATPVDGAMPGVEIHAQMLETILTGEQLVRPDYATGAELFLAVMGGLLIIALVPRVGALPTLASGAVFMVVIAGFCWYLFTARLTLLDGVFPLLSDFVIWLVLTLYSYIREESERRWVRGAFGRYLAPDVVERLAGDPGQLRLGGETRTLTLLFTDVRGFTGISEAYAKDPQGLTTLMNSFLTPLSEAIADRGGTIDKYMGDAIMAFWNAPLDVPDHTGAACSAALDMQGRLDRLNADRAAEAEARGADAPIPIHIGIGLNTGTCVVGNMGSDQRFDYSALGDSVNLASRIEGLTKQYGVTALIGAATAAEGGARYAIVEVDRLRVKGKTEPETVFALLGDEALAASPAFLALRETVDAMQASYRAQDWAAALTRIERARDADADALLTGFLDIFERRIDALREDPPGPGWDGVYAATSK